MLDAIFVLGFILTLINFLIPLLPVRSKLTLLIDHTEFDYVNALPSFTFKVFGNVVNDSPKSASIISFDVTFNYDKPFEIHGQSDSYGSSMLARSGQTSFTLSRVLVGENNTSLPETSLRSVVVSLLYQDEAGVQEATREQGFL